jgi:hypothetical protein
MQHLATWNFVMIYQVKDLRMMNLIYLLADSIVDVASSAPAVMLSQMMCDCACCPKIVDFPNHLRAKCLPCYYYFVGDG